MQLRHFFSKFVLVAERPLPRVRVHQPTARPIYAFLTALVGALLMGCEDSKPREYTEVAFKPLAQQMPSGMGPMMGAGAMPPMNTSPVDIKVTWTLPEGWMVKDSANGMRIGSFAIPDPALANTGELDPRALDVSVVQLAGDAGGLNANITRWMGQIGLKASPDELADMVKSAPHVKTKSGQDGLIIDFTGKLSGDLTQSKSIYGAIVMTAEYTVFVKAMGDRAKLTAQRAHIKTFCQSLIIAAPKP